VIDDRRRDRGFTLTELLVVITITGILGSIIVAVVTMGLHQQTQAQDRSDAMAQARTAIQRLDRDIRSSDPLKTATDTSIDLCEVQPSTVEDVTYSVVTVGSTVELVADTGNVSNCFATPASTTRAVLLKNLVATTTYPVFNYSPVTGYTAPSDGSVSTLNCLRSGTSPAAYDPSCIGTVTVSLRVQPRSLTSPVQLTDNGTDLRNLA
jgi:prepilin-type N-terminal cleavage/methylation domain-containing protein